MAAAAKATRSGDSGICWISASDEEQSLVFVPGAGSGSTSAASEKGNRMRKSNSKNERTLKKEDKKHGHTQCERSGVFPKDEMPLHHTTTAASVQSSWSATGTSDPSTQVNSKTSTTKSLVCLKDLCPEDKRRIANLIEELARVSEEKEVSVQQLKVEQEHFERKVQQLEQENVMIAQERGSLQQQYRECQEMLGLYQQYLSQQQVKVNQSIAQLSKELRSEEPPSRTSTTRSSGSLLDGSYLSLAATQSQQPQVHGRNCGGGVAAQTIDKAASLSCVTDISPTNKPFRNQKREFREPCAKPHQSHQHCHCQDSGYGTQPYKCDNDSRLKNGHCDMINQHECERLHIGNAISSEAADALTRPVLGHEDWEERRHQLLLQKMQLEVERERLQARLAEQEERLNRQNQQLQQSRLEYSRLQHATQQADFRSSKCINGDPQIEGPFQHHLPTSIPEDGERKNLLEKHSQTEPAQMDNETLRRSSKDIACSPAKSPVTLNRPTQASVIHVAPEASTDFSVVQLLDIVTPVAAPEFRDHSTQKPKTLQRRRALNDTRLGDRSLLTTAGSYLQQDQEESQILQDIFFIC